MLFDDYMAVKRIQRRRYIPEIECETSQMIIQPGQKVTLTWKVDIEGEVKLWSDTSDPCSQGPFNWNMIHELGEMVNPSGEISFSPDVTTSYFITAAGGGGFAGKKVTIHVNKKERPSLETPFACKISTEHARKMVKSHVIRYDPNIEKSHDIYEKMKKMIESGGF